MNPRAQPGKAMGGSHMGRRNQQHLGQKPPFTIGGCQRKPCQRTPKACNRSHKTSPDRPRLRPVLLLMLIAAMKTWRLQWSSMAAPNCQFPAMHRESERGDGADLAMPNQSRPQDLFLA